MKNVLIEDIKEINNLLLLVKDIEIDDEQLNNKVLTITAFCVHNNYMLEKDFHFLENLVNIKLESALKFELGEWSEEEEDINKDINCPMFDHFDNNF